jgi:hypothetical protein
MPNHLARDTIKLMNLKGIGNFEKNIRRHRIFRQSAGYHNSRLNQWLIRLRVVRAGGLLFIRGSSQLKTVIGNGSVLL